MILKNNLYEIISESVKENNPKFILRLKPESIIYRAHFPEMPVTPGVCIIGIATELLSELISRQKGYNDKRGLKLRGARNIKFLSVISPSETPEIIYTFSKISVSDSFIKATATVSAGEITLARLTAEWGLQDESVSVRSSTET